MDSSKEQPKDSSGNEEYFIELEEWKTKMASKFFELTNRIAALEQKRTYLQGNTRRLYSGNTIKEMECDEPDVAQPCQKAKYARITKFFQIFCLLGCLAIVIIFGAKKFIDAHENESAEFKPAKKTQVISYGLGIPEYQYEIPYVHFLISLYTDETWTTEMQEWATAEMSEKLLFEAYIKYANSPSRVRLTVERQNITGGSLFQDSVWFNVHLILELANPEPALGKFYIELLFYSDSWFGKYVDEIPHVFLAITRDFVIPANLQNPIWVTLEECPNTTCLFDIHYEEKVVDELGGGLKSTIDTYVAGHSVFDHYHSEDTMVVYLEPDLSIEQWKEYLEYGYVEWFMAMGGVISFSMTFFFFCSARASILNDHGDLGILPMISTIYSNNHEINKMRKVAETLTSEIEGDDPLKLPNSYPTSTKSYRHSGSIHYTL